MRINKKALLGWLIDYPELLAFALVIFLKAITLTVISAGDIRKAGMVATLGTVMILFSLVPKRGRKARLGACSVLDILISLVLWGDLLYWRSFSDLPSVRAVSQAWQLGPVADAIRALIRPGDFLLFLDVPLLTLVFSGRRNSDNAEASSAAWLTIALFSMGCLFEGAALARLPNQFLHNFFDRPHLIKRIGILNYHLVDAVQSLAPEPPLTEADRRLVREWLKQQRPLHGALFGAAHGRNLIVVQVESLQGFVMNATYKGREITPNLNRLSRKAYYFSNFFSQAAAGNTSDGEFTLNTSLYPLAQQAAFFALSDGEFNSLPLQLRREGYRTIAFHANRPSFWNRQVMYGTLGFEAFRSQVDFRPGTTIGMGLSDRDFFVQVEETLQQTPEPFYAQIVTLSSHTPFKGPWHEGDDAAVIPWYLGAIHYADQALGEFVAALKRSGLLDRSVVVIYGDHPALPAARPELMAFLGQRPQDEYQWQLDQQIPLLLLVPGHAGAVMTDPAGQIDLCPTLLSLMGVEPKGPFLGRNLFAAGNGQSPFVAFRDGSFITRSVVFTATPTPLAWDRTTGRPLPVGMLSALRARVRNHLGLSDAVAGHSLGEVLAGAGHVQQSSKLP